jgi:hypothetical protein
MTIYLDSEKNIKFGYFDRLLVDNFFSFNDLHLLQDLVAFSCWSYSADLLDVSD